MLGEKLGELAGTVTGQRVLPQDGPGPKMETTFQTTGTILGVEVTLIGTYSSTIRPNGSVYGECPWAGVLMAADGAGTWGGAGAGQLSGEGMGVGFRGAVYFQSSPESLKSLDQMAVVYEFDIEGEGNALGSFWEWK